MPKRQRARRQQDEACAEMRKTSQKKCMDGLRALMPKQCYEAVKGMSIAGVLMQKLTGVAVKCAQGAIDHIEDACSALPPKIHVLIVGPKELNPPRRIVPSTRHRGQHFGQVGRSSKSWWGATVEGAFKFANFNNNRRWVN